MGTAKVLIGAAPQYKANLHTHTTVSDGKATPRQVKEAYKGRGYSIVAYTDHEVLQDHSDLNDESFLALTGYEIILNEEGRDWKHTKTCHLNLLAKRANQKLHVCFDPSAKFAQPGSEYAGSVMKRTYSTENINKVIREAAENGFLVVHNHPSWSLEGYEDYSRFEGLMGFEIFNTACSAMDGTEEYNPHYFREMLKLGKQIYPVAADDVHDLSKTNGAHRQAFGGFVMIEALRLRYEEVMEALEKGNFYASTGPVIERLSFQNGILCVKCSPVKEIWFGTATRHGGHYVAQNGYLCEAEFPFQADEGYVYVKIVEENGAFAHTRAYCSGELYEEK